MDLQPDSLKEGDTVIPLSVLATQASIFAGATALGTVLNRAGLSGWWTFAGVLFGAVVGLFTGMIFGRLAFPASSTNVVVVRAGRAALPKTLFAAVVPSLIAGLGVAVLASLLVAGLSMSAALAWALGCSLAAGCFFGFGSALA